MEHQQRPDIETLILALAFEIQQLRASVVKLTETVDTLTDELRN